MMLYSGETVGNFSRRESSRFASLNASSGIFASSILRRNSLMVACSSLSSPNSRWIALSCSRSRYSRCTLPISSCVVGFLGVWFQGDMGSQVWFLLRRFANCHTLQALYDYLNGAIWHAYHARDTRDCTKSENVTWPRLLNLGRFLGDQDDQPITAH